MDARRFGLLAVLCFAVAAKREFKLTVRNKMKVPYFEESVNLRIVCKQKVLIKYLEEAVLNYNDQFKSFQVNFTAPYGYYIDSVNGQQAVYSVDQTFWSIENQDGLLDKGVFTYVPQNKEHIMINLTDTFITHN